MGSTSPQDKAKPSDKIHTIRCCHDTTSPSRPTLVVQIGATSQKSWLAHSQGLPNQCLPGRRDGRARPLRRCRGRTASATRPNSGARRRRRRRCRRRSRSRRCRRCSRTRCRRCRNRRRRAWSPDVAIAPEGDRLGGVQAKGAHATRPQRECRSSPVTARPKRAPCRIGGAAPCRDAVEGVVVAVQGGRRCRVPIMHECIGMPWPRHGKGP
mmetsp:Transcript_14169/g.37709  ORF Transcript_14169/g.37709 Transcript_14169/m.37709 type:complete len:211 (+) Transcript_14169:1261-1893(+)